MRILCRTYICTHIDFPIPSLNLPSLPSKCKNQDRVADKKENAKMRIEIRNTTSLFPPCRSHIYLNFLSITISNQGNRIQPPQNLWRSTNKRLTINKQDAPRPPLTRSRPLVDQTYRDFSKYLENGGLIVRHKKFGKK